MRYHQIKLRVVFYWNTFKDISTSNFQKVRASNKTQLFSYDDQ